MGKFLALPLLLFLDSTLPLSAETLDRKGHTWNLNGGDAISSAIQRQIQGSAGNVVLDTNAG